MMTVDSVYDRFQEAFPGLHTVGSGVKVPEDLTKAEIVCNIWEGDGRHYLAIRVDLESPEFRHALASDLEGDPRWETFVKSVPEPFQVSLDSYTFGCARCEMRNRMNNIQGKINLRLIDDGLAAVYLRRLSNGFQWIAQNRESDL